MVYPRINFVVRNALFVALFSVIYARIIVLLRVVMGAKASTANSDDGARERTFSTGSASEVVASSGFNILRSIPSLGSTDRQRARSLSSVPDGHENVTTSGDSPCDIQILETENNSADDNSLDSPLATNIGLSLGLGRVYTARSLPSHIWSLNGGCVLKIIAFA